MGEDTLTKITTTITKAASDGKIDANDIPEVVSVASEITPAKVEEVTGLSAKVVQTIGDRIAEQIKTTAPEGRKTTEFYAMLFTQALIGILVFKFAFLSGATSLLALLLLPVMSGIVTAIYTLVRYLIKREWLRNIVSKIQEGANS